MRMEEMRQGQPPESDVEFQKGCSICEHNDPELERLLEEFARWLYEVMLADKKKKRDAEKSRGIDAGP